MKRSICPKFNFLHQIIITIPKFIIPAIVVILIVSYLVPDCLYLVLTGIIYTYHFFTGFQSNPSDFCINIMGKIGILFYPLVIFFLFIILKKLFYKRVTFSLDDTGITYTINFIIYSQKHVNYSDIKEINLDQGPLQRLFKLATIKITTHATTANAGIELYNLKPYHEVYEFLMSKKNSK